MAQIHPVGRLTTPAGHVLGRKLDSIPFSPYHMMLIAVLALVGFVDGYDLVMTGSLLVLAKQPLHLSSVRYPISGHRVDDDDLRRRLHRVGDFRSLQPQDRHADRRGRDNPLHARCSRWCRRPSS